MAAEPPLPEESPAAHIRCTVCGMTGLTLRRFALVRHVRRCPFCHAIETCIYTDTKTGAVIERRHFVE